MNRILLFLLTLTTLTATAGMTPHVHANEDGIRLLVTGSRVSESAQAGRADVLQTGNRATYSLILENDHPFPRSVDVTLTLPPGQAYLPWSLRVNGLPATIGQPLETPTSDGVQLAWPGLILPGAPRVLETNNLAGIHLFFKQDPTHAEIDERIAWAVRLLGRGGMVKFYLPKIKQQWDGAPPWISYAVRRCYEEGMRPVVRLGFENGDMSSFTRTEKQMFGQMSRADAEQNYVGIGGAIQRIVHDLLDQSADVAAAAPSDQLTIILGNEPNLEWLEFTWFVDYDEVKWPDGSLDPSWLTTQPDHTNAVANTPNGRHYFVIGFPRPGVTMTPDQLLDDYEYYLGYDAAIEYGRFLRTSSRMLRALDTPRVRIAAGAIASGGGSLDARYGYHQHHFYRRMLQAVPDALASVDLLTTNNYPYSRPPWDNYHRTPADFSLYPRTEHFWRTESTIDSYLSDLDYVAHLHAQGIGAGAPTRGMIGEMGYGISGIWATAYDFEPINEDLRARYMSDIFETYYNHWRETLADVNLWQLGDPDVDRDRYHPFNYVYPDSQMHEGWPTHRHLVYDAIATRASRPGAGRMIMTIETQISSTAPLGPTHVHATLSQPVSIATSYALTVAPTPTTGE